MRARASKTPSRSPRSSTCERARRRGRLGGRPVRAGGAVSSLRGFAPGSGRSPPRRQADRRRSRGHGHRVHFLVSGKARPVLIVSDQLDPRLGELLALRLLRLSKLGEREQEEVRRGREPSLLHLAPDRFDLPDENAAMIAALVRVHRSAIDPRTVGHLDRDELRTVHGLIARHYRLDLHQLIRAELQRLAAAQRGRRM